jgi:ABC-type transport system substrate-binding protein
VNSKKETFREVGGAILSTAADASGAKAAYNAALSSVGLSGATFDLTISVAGYDEEHLMIAELVAAAWKALGINVTVKAVDPILNNDTLASTGQVDKKVRDDIFAEDLASGNYEVIAYDLVGYGVTPFVYLAQFAKGFNGVGMDMYARGEDGKYLYEIPENLFGWDNEAYNALIASALEENDLAKRTEILHEAEDVLLDDMGVIPVVFNKRATLQNTDVLKNVKYDYTGLPNFTKTTLKDWETYLPEDVKQERAEAESRRQWEKESRKQAEKQFKD